MWRLFLRIELFSAMPKAWRFLDRIDEKSQESVGGL